MNPNSYNIICLIVIQHKSYPFVSLKMNYSLVCMILFLKKQCPCLWILGSLWGDRHINNHGTNVLSLVSWNLSKRLWDRNTCITTEISNKLFPCFLLYLRSTGKYSEVQKHLTRFHASFVELLDCDITPNICSYKKCLLLRKILLLLTVFCFLEHSSFSVFIGFFIQATFIKNSRCAKHYVGWERSLTLRNL